MDNIIRALRSTGLARERVIQGGIQLWGDGDDALELGLVVEGELVARVLGAELGRIRAGEMVGETAAWFGGRRTAEVAAVTQTRLLIMPRTALSTLRERHGGVYDLLLSAGLHAMARRVRDVDLDIAKRAEGSLDRPDRGVPPWWKKLAATVGGDKAGDAPPPESALRMLGSLKGCPAPVMLDLKKAMTPKSYANKEAVFLQDDEGDSVFVVAAGRIGVLRNVRGNKAVVLASLGPGGLFGTGAAILGARRNANCIVGSEFAWVFEITRAAIQSRNDEVRRIWNETLLGAMRVQLATADDQLAALDREGRQPRADDYDRIQGLLQTYQGS